MSPGTSETGVTDGRPLGPIEQSSRIDVLDILRGFALIGIIFMNIEWFSRSIAGLGTVDETMTGVDFAAGWLVRCFVEGKFYKIFALLFGMGFTIMLLRAQQVGRPFGAWFARRMLVLLLFGLLHLILLWGGDILHDYAIGGLIFLGWVYLFRTRRLQRFNKPVAFLKIGIVWLLLPVFAGGVVGMVYGVSSDNTDLEAAWTRDVEIAEIVSLRLAEPPAEEGEGDEAALEGDAESGEEPDEDRELTDEERKEQRIEELVSRKRENAAKTAEEDEILSKGSYLDGVKHRLVQVPKMLGIALPMTALLLLPIFLVGYWFIASGVLREHRKHHVLFRNMAMIGLSSGFVLSVAGLLIFQHPAADVSRSLAPIGGTLFHLSQFLMSAGYIGVVVLLVDSRFGHKLQSLLAPFGRMALTNYIAQSVVLSVIFYGHGFGLYGTVPRALQLLLATGILVIQILYSKWWLARYRFGPLEWIWRSATYKSLQPMKISP